MKLWLVFCSDGYDVHQLVGVYTDKDAAELHEEALNEAAKRPDGTLGADYGVLEEWDTQDEFDFERFENFQKTGQP